jgi:hypothetical protein
MKLTQFALAAIIVLLTVAGYLTLKSDLDSRLEAQNTVNAKLVDRIEQLSKVQSAPAPAPTTPVVPAAIAQAPTAAVSAASPTEEAPTTPAASKAPPVSEKAAEAIAAAAAIPADAPLAPENDPRMLEDERNLIKGGSAERSTLDTLTLPSTLEGQPLTKIQQRILAAPAIARVKEYAVKEGMLVLDRGTEVGLKGGDIFSLRRKTAVIGRIRISDTIEANESVADVLPGSMPPGMLPAASDEVIKFEP